MRHTLPIVPASQDRIFYVYVLTGVLYTGITNHLTRRVAEHKQKQAPGFSQRYNPTQLVRFEVHGEPKSAIAREEQIKSWSRPKKLELITNPGWLDLLPNLK